jgi:ADP-heptose:LPS heptosyltransferase
MMKNLGKWIEKYGKKIIKVFFDQLFKPPQNTHLPLSQIDSVLLFRLDNRIGNGILLLPLIKAIYRHDPGLRIDVLINHNVAKFLQSLGQDDVFSVIPYDQHFLLRNPIRFWRFFRHLRKQKYAIVMSATNPDQFSLSQAVIGKMINGGQMIGFAAKNANQYYDITVESSTRKHYANAMIDLWRHWDPNAVLDFNLATPFKAAPSNGKILFWLGATGDKHLSDQLVTDISTLLEAETGLPVVFGFGPADGHLRKDYNATILAKSFVSDKPLDQTAVFFSAFRCFVATDTGPLHMAAIIGQKTIGIFTRVNYKQYGYHDEQTHFTFKIDRKNVDWPALKGGVQSALNQFGLNKKAK